MLYGQSKVSVTTVLPAELNICGDTAHFSVDVRNITTQGLSNVWVKLDLPDGLVYVKGSVFNSASEKNVNNLNEPEFDLGTIAFTQSKSFTVAIEADCKALSAYNKGQTFTADVTTNYQGGAVTETTSPISVQAPSIAISSITNQLASANKGESLVRTITISNTGKGSISSLVLFRSSQNGISQLGTDARIGNLSNDTFISPLTSTDFKQIGDKDDYFEKNESIVISDTVRVDDCDSLETRYWVSWGCKGSLCAVDQKGANVSLKPVNPLVTAQVTSDLDQCLAATNKHQHSITFTNSGKDSAYDMYVDIYQGVNTSYYQYMLSELVPTSFKIRWGQNGTSTFINPTAVSGTSKNGTYSCLSSIPIGRAAFDLPNIAPGDTLIISWESQSCCNTNCGAYAYINRWRYSFSYTNQCDVKTEDLYNIGSYGYYQSVASTPFFPTDVLAGDTVDFKFNLTRAYFIPFTKDAELKVIFTLPKGLKHSLNSGDFGFFHSNGSSWTPNSLTQSGDSVIAVFEGFPKVTMIRSDLIIRLIGDCSSLNSSGQTSFNLSMLYQPDKTCTAGCAYPVLCESGSLRFHCIKTCKGGMLFSDFDVERTSFDKPDNDNDGKPDGSGKLDMDKVAKEKCMVGDTLTSVFRGKVSSAQGNPNWRYGKATSYVTYGSYLDVAEARIKIYRNGSMIYNCPNVVHTYSNSGVNRTFFFDFSYQALSNNGCNLYSTFAYLNTDSVELIIKYVVSNVGNAIRDAEFTNTFYLSNSANPNASQRYQCDTFSGKALLVGYYFTNYGRNTVVNRSCDDVVLRQNYYLSVGPCCSNYAGNNIFPYEYRSFATLDKIYFDIPDGYKPILFSFNQRRTAGTGKVILERVDTILPINPGADTLIFDTDALLGSKISASDDGFYGTFTARLRPTCETPNYNKIPVRYDFEFKKYSYFSGPKERIASRTQSDEIAYSKPLLKLTAQDDEVEAQSDSAIWVVNLTNGSNVSDAENAWLAMVPKSGIKLVKVIDNTNNAIHWPANGIVRLGNYNKNTTRTYTIYTQFDQCNPDSIELMVGSDCFEYPDSASAGLCFQEKIKLKYQSASTTLESTLKGPAGDIDLCSPQRYQVTISNVGQARVYDLGLMLYLRGGVTVKDSIWLQLKGSTDSILILSAQDLGANQFYLDLASASSLLDTAGFRGANESDNSLTVSFNLTTNCNFISSSRFFVQPVGTLKCGEPVTGVVSISPEMNIKNIKKSYFSNVSVEMDSIDVCKGEQKAIARFINLGPDTTGIEDGFEFEVPIGVTIDSNYLVDINMAPTAKPVYSTVNGRNFIRFDLPSGMQPGDSSKFEFKYLIDYNQLSCAFNQFYYYAVIRDSAFCVSQNQYCTVKAATSSGYYADSIEKAEYDVAIRSIQSVTNTQGELVTLSYGLRNTNPGTDPGTSHRIRIYDDVNSNGLKDAGDTVIAMDTLANSLTRSFQYRTFDFIANSDQTCRLLLVLDSGLCECDVTQVSLPVPSLQNAGSDTTVCSGEVAVLGSINVPGQNYTWSGRGIVGKKDSSILNFKLLNTGKADSTYALVLTTQKKSCSSTDTAFVTVHPGFVGLMNPQYEKCRGSFGILGSSVTGGTGKVTYQWSPDYELERLTFQYTKVFADSAITYYRTMTDVLGCTAKDSVTLVIREAPDPFFTTKPTCEGDSVRFIDASAFNQPKQSIQWNFGNGQTGTDSLHTVWYDTSGTYQVSLIATDQLGCKDTFTKSITLNPLPEIDFDTLLTRCGNDSILLINRGSIDTGSFTTQWIFNQDVYNGDTVKGVPNGYGQQVLTIRATSDQGCVSLEYDTFDVIETPVAQLQFEHHCFGKTTTISAIDTMVTQDSIASYSWVVDGNNYTDSSFQVTLGDTGIHAIRLDLTSNKGCVNTILDTLVVYDRPVAQMSLGQIPCITDTLTVYDRSSVVHGGIDSIRWTLPSLQTATSDSIDVVIDKSNSFDLTLMAYSGFGCGDTLVQTITTAYKEPPQLSITGNCQFDAINFQFTPNEPDSIQQYQVDIIGQYSGSNNTFNVAFDTARTYDLYQRIETVAGCVTDTVYQFTIHPKPEASFNYNLPCDDVKIDLYSTSTTASGTIVTYDWQFGNGIGSSDSANSFSYADTGTYDIELQVRNNFGCADTVTGPVYIPTTVEPGFRLNTTCSGIPQYVLDTTQGRIAPISQIWFAMGNGDTIRDRTGFNYAYPEAGTFNATMQFITNPGCVYTQNQSVLIEAHPKAGFKLAPDFLTIADSRLTIADRSENAQRWEYTISDGSNYLNPNAFHEFTDTGSFDVTQVVYHPLGCNDTLTQSVFIHFVSTLYIPNSFTPNGDGINETFAPVGLGIGSYTMSIFNRWGQKVWETSDDEQEWKGLNVDPGQYIYMIRLIDYEGKVSYHRGSIRLVR
jgi:gliding motility-associated-like protein/uncharacterized repeat protein (TIGR01451 family)